MHQRHQDNFLYVQTYLAIKRILILILINERKSIYVARVYIFDTFINICIYLFIQLTLPFYTLGFTSGSHAFLQYVKWKEEVKTKWIKEWLILCSIWTFYHYYIQYIYIYIYSNDKMLKCCIIYICNDAFFITCKEWIQNKLIHLLVSNLFYCWGCLWSTRINILSPS